MPKHQTLGGSHPELEGFLFRHFEHHAALNYCGPLARTRYAWAYRRLSTLAVKESTRVLDVGCGGGFFTIAAGNLANEVVGASTGNLAGARRRAQTAGYDHVTFVEKDVVSPDFASVARGRLFDIITCLEVIEHLEEPSRAIENMAAVLKPGGHLVLSTPNVLHRPLAGEDTYLNNQPGGHIVYGYDELELAELLEQHGLDAVSTYNISNFGDHILNNLSRRLTPVTPLGALVLTSALYPLARGVDIFGEGRFPPIAFGIVAQNPTDSS